MNTDQYTCITEEGKKNYAENEINLIKERLNFFFEALLEKKLSDDYLLVVGHPNSEEVKNILNNFRNKIIIVIADEQKSIKYFCSGKILHIEITLLKKKTGCGLKNYYTILNKII